ncbi:MAG TPA: DUF3180 domain-containing protein [Mycobacteriales bacterium]
MKPTRVSVLLGTFAAGGIIGGAVLGWAYGDLPELPASWVVPVVIIAVLLAFLAWTTRNRLTMQRGARPVDPLTVARYAALARACSPVGALLTGLWLGGLVFLLTQRGSLDAVSHDRNLSIAGMLSGAALTAAALWLEWVCRIKVDDEDDEHRRRGRRENGSAASA